MPDEVLLDHMVVNVRFEMDRAVELFAAAGFQLTPRGFHSLGSINHLMILDTNYLELLGLPVGEPPRRAEIADAPIGINGLVFKSNDIKETFEHLGRLGIAGAPPKSFSRPVDIGGETREAAFSTVTVRPDVFAAGRVYFCQHHTPELVWRDEWRHHANGAFATESFSVVAVAPAREAGKYGEMLGLEAEAIGAGHYRLDLGGSSLEVLGEAAYRARFSDLALSLDGRESMFGAICLRAGRAGELGAITDRLDAAQLRHAPTVAGIAVQIPPLQTVLEFVA